MSTTLWARASTSRLNLLSAAADAAAPPAAAEKIGVPLPALPGHYNKASEKGDIQRCRAEDAARAKILAARSANGPFFA